MVVYNFMTTDTNESPIYAFRVHMIDNKGNIWIESEYDGCGVFGGKDIFLLIAEMNNKHTREDGYALFVNKKNGTIYPNLYRYYDDAIIWQDVKLYSNNNYYNNNYNNNYHYNNCDDNNCETETESDYDNDGY